MIAESLTHDSSSCTYIHSAAPFIVVSLPHISKYSSPIIHSSKCEPPHTPTSAPSREWILYCTHTQNFAQKCFFANEFSLSSMKFLQCKVSAVSSPCLFNANTQKQAKPFLPFSLLNFMRVCLWNFIYTNLEFSFCRTA
jgi:hypothetical protein